MHSQYHNAARRKMPQKKNRVFPKKEAKMPGATTRKMEIQKKTHAVVRSWMPHSPI
jgi:hypothetical protein